MDAMRRANKELVEEQLAKNPEFRLINDSQQAYMRKVREWTIIGEYAYLRDNQ